MPDFTEDGKEKWICQRCKKTFNSDTKPEWRPDITENKSAANVCPRCRDDFESGLFIGTQIFWSGYGR